MLFLTILVILRHQRVPLSFRVLLNDFLPLPTPKCSSICPLEDPAIAKFPFEWDPLSTSSECCWLPQQVKLESSQPLLRIFSSAEECGAMPFPLLLLSFSLYHWYSGTSLWLYLFGVVWFLFILFGIHCPLGSVGLWFSQICGKYWAIIFINIFLFLSCTVGPQLHVRLFDIDPQLTEILFFFSHFIFVSVLILSMAMTFIKQ